MKYCLFFFFYIVLNFTNTSAAIKISYADTNINKLSYKQSKQYFLEKYGKDDSTRALINYFFKKRIDGIYETFVPLAVGGGSALLLNNIKVGAMLILVPITLALVLYACPIYIINGQVKWISFSRKRLLGYLIDYNSGKPLPKRVKRRKAFKYELEKLKQAW